MRPEIEAVLAFRAGGERFAVLVDAVREAARVRRLVPLPGAPPCWAGVAIVRGEPFGVLDVARAAGRPPGHGGLLIVLHGRDQALLVDRIEGVLHVPKERPTPGSIESPEGRIGLLDLPRFLSASQT